VTTPKRRATRRAKAAEASPAPITWDGADTASRPQAGIREAADQEGIGLRLVRNDRIENARHRHRRPDRRFVEVAGTDPDDVHVEVARVSHHVLSGLGEPPQLRCSGVEVVDDQVAQAHRSAAVRRLVV
jgi:hypothetical protein